MSSQLKKSQRLRIILVVVFVIIFVSLFRLFLDNFALAFGEQLSSIERVITFCLAVTCASLVLGMIVWISDIEVRLIPLGAWCGVGGVVYMYIFYPLVNFDQGLLLTVVQVFTDIPSVINVILLLFGPAVFGSIGHRLK